MNTKKSRAKRSHNERTEKPEKIVTVTEVVVVYYNQFTGHPQREEWYRGGKLHRENAPAVIEYGDTGDVIHQEWWEDGEFVRAYPFPTLQET
jgi:hypothetical protein